MRRIATLILTGFLAFGCSDSDDPSAESQEDLSPPLNLRTVTGDGKVELRWDAVNFEEDLVGYHVFISGVDKRIGDLSAPVAPTGVDIGAKHTVPYCTENAGFFKEFGITAEPGSACDLDSSFTLLQDDAAADADADGVGVGAAKVTCYDPAAPDTAWGDENISLPKSATNTGVGVQTCLIKTDQNGDALVNGKSYSFFVVAVVGESFDGISWTSNVVDDTPAKAVVDNEGLQLAAKKYVVVTFDTTALDTAITLANLTVSDCPAAGSTAQVCGVSGTNAQATDGIYIARDNTSASYPQRIFVSTSTAGNIELIYRGDQLMDPKFPDAITTRIPGDEAMAAGTYYMAKGSQLSVRDRMVYDFVITVGAAKHYGKIAFGDVSYASDASSIATIPTTIVVQTKPDTTHYMKKTFNF